MINIIVAYNENRVIGKEGKLPWSIPEDLKRFKKLTMGHPIIMGRKTHESIGKVLPGRKNIIISRNKDYIPLGPFTEPIFVVQSMERAIQVAELEGDNLFIIGGGEIYKQSIDFADRIYATHVKDSSDGDVHFPDVPGLGEWTIVEEVQGSRCDFVTWVKEK